jgi:signal transduction histidine kinase
MLAAAQTLAVRFRDRVETKGLEHGLGYPWWVPAFSGVGMITGTAVALAQRDALLDPQWVTLALALVLTPHVLHVVAPFWIPWWFDAPLMLTGLVWVLSVPTDANGAEYVVPLVASFLAAETTVTEGLPVGAFVTVTSVALLVAFDPGITLGSDISLLALTGGLGFFIGCTMRWQMRALAAEKSARAQEAERATLAERQRIAREIHDLVAHSLSVTMLHVGGARQALVAGDDGTPDVDDALAALSDAEQVGRQAMAEIRRTVSVLATEPAGAHPLPCAEDIPDLVGRLRDAGHPVTYDARGDLTTLPPTAGLGFYRVLQEALTNATKHAPGEPVTVRVDVGGRRAHLAVRNRRASVGPAATDGSGTAGMTSRAEQLGGTLVAGPDPRDPGQWLVDLSIPVGASSLMCAVKRVFQ